MKKLLILFAALVGLTAPLAQAQTYGLLTGCQLQTATGQAVPGAQVYVLDQPANTSNLTPLAAVYSSSTGSAVTQPFTTNGFGQCSTDAAGDGAYLAPGVYTVVYVSQYTGTLIYKDQPVFLPTGANSLINPITQILWPIASGTSLPSYLCPTGTTGNLTSGTASVIVGSVDNIYVNQLVTGTGIPANTYVLSINASASTVTLNQNATVTQNGVSLSFISVGQPFQDTSNNQEYFCTLGGWAVNMPLTLQQYGTPVPDQALLNAGNTPAAPEGNTNVTWQNDSLGDWSAYVPTAETNLINLFTPPISGQYVIIYPTAYTTTGGATASDTGAVIPCGATATCADPLSSVTWTGFSYPAYVNPADITGIYPFSISSVSGIPSEVPFTFGYCEDNGAHSSAIIPYSSHANEVYGMQMYSSNATSTWTASDVANFSCTAYWDTSEPSSGVMTLAQMGIIIYYTGPAPPATLGFNVVPPLYVNGATDALELGQIDLSSSVAVLNQLGAYNGGTGQDSSSSTGVAQVASGTWSFSTALANGTTATTQTTGDDTTQVATDAFVLANTGSGGITALTGDVTASGSGSVPATVAEIQGGALPTSALFGGWNGSRQPVAATAANLATFLSGLTGCATTAYAYVPADSKCEAVGGGVSSFSGDGTLLSNSSSTGAVTATLENAGAHRFFGNNTGSSGASAYDLLGASDVSIPSYVAGGGTAQAQTVTLSPAATALTAGLTVKWLPVAANTGAAPSLNVNGLGAETITKFGTTALVANDLVTTAIAVAIYDGTDWELQNPNTFSSGNVTTSGTITSGYFALFNGSTTVVAGSSASYLDYNVTQGNWITTHALFETTQDGSPSNASYSFQNNLGTGMYLPASNTLGFAADSHDTLNVLSNAVILAYNSQSTPSSYEIATSGDSLILTSVNALASNATVTFGDSSGTPAVTASSPLAITAATGNITCSTCAVGLTGTTGTITGTVLSATCDSGTATVTGAVVGSPVAVGSTTGVDVGGAFYLRGSVTATGTVTVYVCGTGTPSSLAYNVEVF